MEEKIVEEIMKECASWRERLLVKLFKKEFIKAYAIGNKNCFNNINSCL